HRLSFRHHPRRGRVQRHRALFPPRGSVRVRARARRLRLLPPPGDASSPQAPDRRRRHGRPGRLPPRDRARLPRRRRALPHHAQRLSRAAPALGPARPRGRRGDGLQGVRSGGPQRRGLEGIFGGGEPGSQTSRRPGLEGLWTREKKPRLLEPGLGPQGDDLCLGRLRRRRLAHEAAPGGAVCLAQRRAVRLAPPGPRHRGRGLALRRRELRQHPLGHVPPPPERNPVERTGASPSLDRQAGGVPLRLPRPRAPAPKPQGRRLPRPVQRVRVRQRAAPLSFAGRPLRGLSWELAPL
ncbi:hypothetical protein H632_c4293p0, partial [Helicosporidium sp. ATCC 50920]